MERASLRPITDAELTVVPWRERSTAFAAGGRRPPPYLHVVREGAGGRSAFHDPDLVLALTRRAGPGHGRTVVGSVVVAERARYLAVPPPIAGSAPSVERLMVIDRLWVADGMSDWRPPLRALLVAMAAMTIATVAHDGSARTCVACRVGPGDEAGMLAMSAMGAGPPEPRGGLARVMWPGVHSIEDLRFLDTAAAAVAARIALDHLDRSTMPARPMALIAPSGHEVEGVLSLGFPRALTALRDEIRLIAEGAIRLDWRRPAIAMNDLDAHLRRTACPSGG